MTIFLKKFGTTLNGRQFGRESFAAFEPSLRDVKNDEDVVVDFEGVVTFTPSWGDEFLPLIQQIRQPVNAEEYRKSFSAGYIKVTAEDLWKRFYFHALH